MTDTQGDGVPEPQGPDAKRQARRRAVARYVPIVGWLPRYDRADLRFDAVAGIVSWGVMVPVAMAYAGLAGMPPETGLVTAFAALAAYAVFGTSRHLKVTASSSVAILSASVVGAILSSRDPASYVALSAGLALVVGVILVVAGAARLGFLSQFLAISVVTGFVIGLAITITIGQLPGLLGIPAVVGTTLERLVGMGQEVLELTDPITAVLGVGSLVGILLLKRIAPRIPGPLIALIVGIALSTALDLSARGVEVVGEIQTGVPLPSIPRLPLGDLVFLITGAFGIVFLALAESIGAARSFGARHGYDIDPDQELVALGASNVASGLFGGFAVDASFSNSATAESAGNRTQLASLITAGLILATAIVLAPLFQNLPTAVLAAIVISSRARPDRYRRAASLLPLEADRLPARDDGAHRRRQHDRPDRDGDRGRPVIAGHPLPGQPAVHRGPRSHPWLAAGLRRRGSPPDRRAGRGLPSAASERAADLRERRCREGPRDRACPGTSRPGPVRSSSTSVRPRTSTWPRPTC